MKTILIMGLLLLGVGLGIFFNYNQESVTFTQLLPIKQLPIIKP